MLIALQIVNALSFAYMAYVLAGVLTDSLGESLLLKPIAITICSATIAYHLHETNAWAYIVAGFAGFFLHTCSNSYTKKVKAPTPKNRKKVVNINP